MFGIGFPELLFILLLAVLVLGPEHTPRAARMIGRWSAKMRSAATSLSQAVAEDENLREISQSMTIVKNEISQTTSEITGAIGASHQTLQEARAELKSIGREPESQTTDSSHYPHLSADDMTGRADFMNRPLNWFDDDSMSGTAANGVTMQTIRLKQAVEPIGAITDFISNGAVRLDKPQPNTQFQPVAVHLELPVFRGFCRIRPLERCHNAKPSCLRTIHLIRVKSR